MVHCRFTLLSLALVTLATCAESLKRIKRQQIGSVCNENIDCLTITGGGYCDSTKRCACLTTSVSIGGFCWPKINPGQTGCQYQAQCDSMWPGSTCDSTNVCRCPGNQPPAQTNDGIVCRRSGGCPTNSLNSKLKDGNGVDKNCDAFFDICGLDYDCFCPSLLTPGPNCPDGTNYCCPSRAMACIMPKEEGTAAGGTVLNKFWFNSATGNCEPLSFTGTGGNANNFDSIAQCESYCKTACLRGRPQYNDDTAATGGTFAITCSSTTITTTNPCDSDSYCYIRDTSLTSYCCPRQTTICTGDVTDATFAGETTPTIQPRIRYYYDTTTQTCLPFTYQGQVGTYNNFATQAECTTFCASSTCGTGDILRDTNQVPVVCSSNADCPTRYTCVTNRCCPTQEFICNLPMVTGTCSSPSRKWYFNADTRTCTEFTYNGCQGNFNNFDSYNACQTYCGSSAAAPKCPQGIASRESDGTYTICSASTTTTTSFSVCPVGYYCTFDGVRYGCCPTKSQTCEVEGANVPSSFLCITPVTRWYYNTTSRQCAQFSYNGCDGTSNNFGTQLDCQDYCGVGGCKDGGGEPLKDAGGQYRVCTANGNECLSGYTCSQVTTITSTVNMFCCPTKETVCKLQKNEGVSCGISSLTRYYFNQVTRLCESFIYRGCQGNRNNFATAIQCQRYCNSAACAPGQIAYSDPVSNALTTCQATTTSTATGCLPGYQCVTSNLLNQGVCCGSNAPSGTCPQGQSAFMDAFTGVPMQCLQNTDGQCPLTPNRFSCQASFTTGSSFCCAAVIVQCSRGGTVGQDALGNPLACTPNIQQNCQSGYECQPVLFQTTTFLSATGYCCGTPNPCGQGFNTLFVNNQPVTCDISVTTSTCSDNRYSCTRTATGQGFCCVSSSAGINPCASGGKSPYLIQGAPTVCIPGSGNTGAGCPVGYTCDLYTAVMTSYCCTTGGTSIGQNSCPTGSPSATTCTVNANCGSGFVCKPGSASSICCPSPASACSQPQTAGQTCTTATQGQRYSYNPSTRSCTAFTYLGCGGNSNNFFSSQACEEFCMTALCARGKTQYVTGGAAQTCSTAAQCNSGYQCSVPQFGGGASVCCELPTTVCGLPMDAGRSCSAVTIQPMQLWYFSSATRTCVQFNFNGCGGNANSFETQSECQTFCGVQPPPTTNPCPSPRTVQTNPATNQPVLCISAACATGFICTYSSTLTNYYCCSRPTVTAGINGCPSGSPSLFPRTNSPLACTVGGARCPTNYACVKSTSYSGYQCCSSTSLVSIPTSSSIMPALKCTASDYCITRLKSTNAICNLSTLLCSCGATEVFANDSCGSGSTVALTQAATMPIFHCTSDDYCIRRLKSSKATCKSLKCSCDSSERYANDVCVPGTTG